MFKNYTAQESLLQRFLVILVNSVGQKKRKIILAQNRDVAENVALQGEKIGTKVKRA